MGNCCRKLENIDHVEDMDDLIIVVEEDITTYRKNIQIFNSDKTLNNESKSRKVEYFETLVRNLQIIYRDLRNIKNFKKDDIIEFKEKYRAMSNDVYSLNTLKLENNFNCIHKYLEKFILKSETPQ